MLKILIVEDSGYKLEEIAAVIMSVPGLDPKLIETAPDVATAIRALAKKRFDLLVLDLNLPERLGDGPTMGAGLKLLKTIDRRGRLHPPSHVVAITEFDEAATLSATELKRQLWGVLSYAIGDGTWKPALRSKIVYLVDSKRSLIEDESRSHTVDIAIVTALHEELVPVHALTKNLSERKLTNDPVLYYEGSFEGRGKSVSVVSATAGKMGMAATAVLAANIISRFRPRFIAMVGIAAGIPGKADLGDVLIADPSWDWGSGKFEVVKRKAVFNADPEQLRINSSLRNMLQAAANDAAFMSHVKAGYGGPRPVNDLKAIVCGVASGAAVIGDEKVVSSIRKQKRKMVGVEMETYGLMMASECAPDPKPLAFSAKSVSDFADTSKDDSNRHYATYTSARFVHDFALRYLSDKSRLDDLSAGLLTD